MVSPKNKHFLLLAVSLVVSVNAPGICMTEADKQEAIQEQSAVWMRLSRQADGLKTKGKSAEAIEIYRKILKERKDLGLKGSNERIELAKLLSLSNDSQTKSEAETIYKDMVAESEEEFGAEDFCMAYPLGMYADFLKAGKRTAEEKKIRDRIVFVEKHGRTMPEKEVKDIISQAGLTPEQKADKLFELGKLYIKRDRDDKAIYCLDACLKLNPRHAEAYSERGESHARMTKDVLAKTDYDAAIKCNPKITTAYFRRGLWYEGRNSLKAALLDFNEAIKINPKDTDVLGYRAKLLSRMGSNKAAIADYDAAIAVDPSKGWPYVQRASLFVDMGKFQQGIDDFNLLVKRYPRNTDYLEFRASAFEKAGRTSDAIKDYDEIVKMNPDLSGIAKRRDELAKKQRKAASH